MPVRGWDGLCATDAPPLARNTLFLVVGAGEVGKLYGTAVHPVTRIVANELGGQFGLFVILIIAFVRRAARRWTRTRRSWTATRATTPPP
jgi:hypothetical protein